MTEEQSYVPLRNKQRNSCDCARQGAAFDLEKYGPCIDKIRALFVPSLEYRIRCLLEEFVYSTDSRSARRFPRFKRFVDAMATWKGPMNKLAEYDVSTIEDAIGSIVNCSLKDDLITCFLDSIVLHHRLSKICRELDALGIEDNMLRSLNVWNFVHERNHWANHDHLTNPDSAANRNANSSVATRRDAKRPAKRGKVVEPLTTSDVYCDGSAEHVRSIASDHRTLERRQVPLDSSRDLPRREEGNRNHRVYPATESQPGGPAEARDERSRAGESEAMSSASRLKLIVRKMYLEDCGCSTLARPVVTRLPLPCKSSDLIGRIFEVDPSLTESCLILMRRKFQVSVRNVCSCLNDVLSRLNTDESRLTTKALRLSCEIRPGYISFRLKTDGGVRKCLFVARIPICQNVHKRTVPRDSAAASSSDAKPRDGVEESKSPERHEADRRVGFDDKLASIEEESEGVDDTPCSRLHQNPAEVAAVRTSQDRVDDGNTQGTALRYSIDEKVSEPNYELTICSCNKRCEQTVETVSDVTSLTGNPEERNEAPRGTWDARAAGCNENTGEEDRKEALDSAGSIAKNDEPTRSANGAYCACSPDGNPAETSDDDVENIPSGEDLDNLSQTAGLGTTREWACSPNKEFDSGSTDRSRADTSSITTFAQNSERDKQLVELTCNRVPDKDAAKLDEPSDTMDVDSLDSARAEIGCDSDCSCCYDDFVDIAVIDDDVSAANTRLGTSRDKLQPRNAVCSGRATKITSKDNESLAASVQTPRLKVLSKGINVDVSYPRAIARLTSGDDVSKPSVVKTRGGCDEATDFAARASAVPKKRDGVSRNADEEVFVDTADRPRGKGALSKRRLRSNADSRHRVATQEDRSTSSAPNTSYACRLLATTETRWGRFREARESRRLRLRYVRAGSSHGARSVTSVTTMRCRTTPGKRQGEHPVDARPQTAFATSRFRKSVGKSVRWMKRLIRAKLAGVLFNHQRAKTTSASRTFRGSDESAGDIAGRRTAGRHVRQSCCATSCSNSDCRALGCAISRFESSDATLPGRRNWGKEKSEGGMKLHDRRLAGGSEVLSSSRSIDTTFPRSYDLLTRAPEDLAVQGLHGGGERRRGKRETENKRGPVIDGEKRRGHDFGNYEKSTAISALSISFADDESTEYLERRARKQRQVTRDSERNRDRRTSGRIQHQAGRRGDGGKKPLAAAIRNTKDESSELSQSSLAGTDEARDNARERSRGISRRRNAAKLSPSGENREALDRHRLRRKRVFALLADTCHDCAHDLDLDFESTLSRYVELCGNVKRSLMRTLWPDDIYEFSTTSTLGSDS